MLSRFTPYALFLALLPSITSAVDFAQDIQPLLKKHCFECHGPEKRKGALRLDRRVDAFRAGESGAFPIVAKKSAESELLKRALSDDKEERMPPKGERLTAAEIATLREWIDAGAQWPDDGSEAEERAARWAFEPVAKVVPPKAEGNPIDAFISAKLAERGLAMSPPAEKRDWLRRVTFDLTGLPPTPRELDEFLADNSPDAFEKVADRLLASPHYGERWARHWLDVARFGESHGFEFDKVREHAWRYRDYVVASFNADKPYNQFVREQIAGDVIGAGNDGIVATGFLVAGPWDEASAFSKSESVKGRSREEELEDTIAAVGQTFLGLTINCARCHAHKFDPIPQQDYYRLKAVFQGVRHGERQLEVPPDVVARQARLADVGKQIAAIETGVPAGPIARWSFENNVRDSIGKMNGELKDGARVERGHLILDGKTAHTISAPLQQSVAEKTFEAWISLASLGQEGGGIITLETDRGTVFDSLVYAERQEKKWMIGSEFYRRTKYTEGPMESAKPEEFVHIAAVFRADNSIALFRNGQPYGKTYKPDGADSTLRRYVPGNAHVLLGKRHTGGDRAFFAGEIDEARIYDRALSDAELAASFAAGPDAALMTREQALEKTASQDLTRLRELRAERDKLIAAEEADTARVKSRAYAAVLDQPGETRMLARGEWDKPGEAVTAGGLSIVAQPASDLGLAANAPEAERRRRFADWLTDSQNPLTARVFVNRVWHWHFGRGIVATPNDFGRLGDKPSHPELLDWLAGELVRSGWRIKPLQRLIVLSAAYRQSSADNASAMQTDADNRLLWRFSPARLSAEEVRDTVMSVSGDINLAMGGPSFRPFDFTVRGNNADYEVREKDGPEYRRRTIYRIAISTARDPLLDSFDCPEFSTKTPVRSSTTTPLQALSLMNHAMIQQQSAKFAVRLERETGGDRDAQVRFAFRLALNREPTTDECRDAAALAQSRGLAQLCWVLFNTNEFVFLR